MNETTAKTLAADVTITDELPNRLSSGAVIVSPAGCRAKVTRTSKRDEFGEPLYRLTYISYGATDRTLHSRDELAGWGARLEVIETSGEAWKRQ